MSRVRGVLPTTTRGTRKGGRVGAGGNSGKVDVNTIWVKRSLDERSRAGQNGLNFYRGAGRMDGGVAVGVSFDEERRGFIAAPSVRMIFQKSEQTREREANENVIFLMKTSFSVREFFCPGPLPGCHVAPMPRNSSENCSIRFVPPPLAQRMCVRGLEEWGQVAFFQEVPPVCDEPLVHQKKPWSMIDSDQFACKPSIYLPQETVYVQEGANVTISCRVDADPPAQTRWTKTDGGRILHGNMTKIPFSNQVYVVEEEGSYSKWTNLTITKVNEQDLGQYTCVGHNFGGTYPQTSLPFWLGGEEGPSDSGIASGIASLVVLILLILLLLCRRRRSRGRPEKPKEIKHNGTVHNHDVGDDMGAYHKVSMVKGSRAHVKEGVATDSDMEMSTRRTGNGLKESSVDELDLEEKAAEMAMIIQRDSYETYDGYNFGGNGAPPDTSAGSSASNRTAETASVHSDHPPPSYNHHAPLGPAYHPLSSLQAPSPTPSSLRNFPDLIDIQHQLQQMDRPTSSQASYLLSHLLPRSFPPPSPSLASGAPTPEPVVAVDWQHLRPAYVTLPRRPRHSPRWASSTPLQSPVPEESLYDTVGPRRTADGSSRLSLNHSDNESPSPMPVTRLEASPSLAGGVSSSGGYISRGVFNYSTLPRGYSPGGNSARSTPSIPEHVGRRQLPVVREESRGPGDEVPEKIKELRRTGRHDDGLPIEKKLSDRQKKIPPAVPTKKKPMSKEISSLYNGHHHHGGGGSSGETSSESPVDSLLQPSSEHTEESDEIGETSYSPQPLINDRKVPPVPPPKPRKPPRTSPLVLGEDGFEDEGSDGTEV
ncbi:unnamed protein product [Cyprideis torosa]|uniref:Uncharacterized protein n=1 Tax=Cyprideis torosa TaxID=163714 RepID=A0A7R8ZQA7_9CRUS|nr:unnamed protein product [Cyprideis torosa]CAG0890233.1 unnamed protein product [Cyprideis torosa]